MVTATGQRRRGPSSAVRIVRALGGLVMLVALLAGVPAALLLLAGNPIPDSPPTLDRIARLATSRDLDGSLLRTTLAYLGWLGWSSFAFSVVLEAVSAVSGRPIPRIRGLHAQRRAAATLVGLVFATVAGPGTAAVAGPGDTATPDAGPSGAVTAPSDAATDVDDGTRPPATGPGASYTVQQGDTLWDIAEDHLEPSASDAEIASAWPRWYDANREVIGDDPDLILPGQRLTNPDAGSNDGRQKNDAPSDSDEAVADTAADENEQGPTPAPEPRPAQPPGDDLAAPSSASEDTPLPVLPDVTAGATPAPAAGHAETDDSGPASHGPSARTAAGIGALLAAGLSALVALGRRGQHARRSEEIPEAAEQTASTEKELWSIADPVGAQLLDRALRDLAGRVGAPPPVRAVRLTPNAVELYLATPVQLPHPWQNAAGATVWELRADLPQHIEPADADEPAPYPCLVSIGHDEEGGLLLVDLGHITALGVDGPPEKTRQIITALAVELACSPLADELSVSVIGACREITDVLGTGRLQYVEQFDALLDALEDPAARVPDVLLSADPLTDDQRRRLADLIDSSPQAGPAAITAGSDGLADWVLRCAGRPSPQAWVLEPVGIGVEPQWITPGDYDHIVEILRASSNRNDHHH